MQSLVIQSWRYSLRPILDGRSPITRIGSAPRGRGTVAPGRARATLPGRPYFLHDSLKPPRFRLYSTLQAL